MVSISLGLEILGLAIRFTGDSLEKPSSWLIFRQSADSQVLWNRQPRLMGTRQLDLPCRRRLPRWRAEDPGFLNCSVGGQLVDYRSNEALEGCEIGLQIGRVGWLIVGLWVVGLLGVACMGEMGVALMAVGLGSWGWLLMGQRLVDACSGLNAVLLLVDLCQ
ncbi:hypothetical protein Dimus_012777 [Dionaea muscipula]